MLATILKGDLAISNINRLIQVLLYATSTTSFSQRSHIIQPTQPLHSANEIDSSTQRSRIHHPAKSNLPPSEVESVTQRSRIRHLNETYKLVQWRTWCERGSFDRNQDASEITSRRIFCYVGTHFLLHRDVANAASGRNFRFLSWLWFLLFPAISQRSGH